MQSLLYFLKGQSRCLHLKSRIGLSLSGKSCFLSITVSLWLFEMNTQFITLSFPPFHSQSQICTYGQLLEMYLFCSTGTVPYVSRCATDNHQNPCVIYWHICGEMNSKYAFYNLVVYDFRKYRLHRKVPKFPAEHPYPGVSVLKPLMGVDPHLLGNLETFFTLTYPKVSWW